jgi:hypothetical protein
VHDISVQTTQVDEWHLSLFHTNLWKKKFTQLLLPNHDPLSMWCKWGRGGDYVG